MYKRFGPLVIVTAVAVLAVRTASAQLELPEKPVVAKDKDKGEGVSLPAKPTGDVAKTAQVTNQNSDGVKHATANEKLDLPSAAVAEKPAAGKTPAAPQNKTNVAAPPSKLAPLPNSAAEFVFGEVRKLKEIDNPVALQAVESLLHMGPAGHDAASAALYDENAVCVIVAARVLLQSGAAEDCERVQQRLRERLPTAACAPLVDTLAKLDPVHASPVFLAELLGHKQAGVRNAAQRQLDALGADLPLAAITPLLKAKESDVRLRALQLLAGSSDPKALPLMLDRLGDPSASVARRAVDALAARDDERIDPELLRRAFSERWVLREQSYDLLAIMEREDTALRPVLTDLHAASLLDGMASKDAFVSGTCAAALAGIGFRSPAVDATKWLDLEVPHRLVRVVAAEGFSPDYSSLTET